MERPKEICEHRSEWNPKNVSRCMPCNVGVNDAGCLQCTICLALFIKIPNQVKKCLKELRGEFWEIEYKKLLRVQALVSKGKVGELILNHYSYHDIYGIIDVIVNERGFYEFIT